MPGAGFVIDAVGGVVSGVEVWFWEAPLVTVTVMGEVVLVFPAASDALAARVWVPVAELSVFQKTW
jgi:hypothetical protein